MTRRLFDQVRNDREMRRVARAGKFRRRKKRKKPSEARLHRQYRYRIKLERERILLRVHRDFAYANGNTLIEVNGEWGLETDGGVESFLDTAERTIEFDTKRLRIDLQNCTRVWPSAVTLMCSLKEWVEFGSKRNGVDHPQIQSTDSTRDDVNSYLTHCGFHTYVGRANQSQAQLFADEHTVRIKRETSRSGEHVGAIEDQIYDLLLKTTKFSTAEIKKFVSTAIMEVFLNVQEHGITCNDQGYWVLAQYHPLHRLVSINIADNGVGFRNSLLSGPQGDQIRSDCDVEDEGRLIEHAMRERVSGALDADVREGYKKHQGYRRGSGRGNGLERISSCCGELGVKLSILSHFGYLMLSADGSITNMGSRPHRVFAGTLYQFCVPTGGQSANR